MTEQTNNRKANRIRLHREQRRAQIGRAAVVGVAAGLAGVGFELCVDRAEHFSLWLARSIPAVVLVCATGAIGCAAAWITDRFAPEASGSGIPHIKAVLLHIQTIHPARLITVKLAAGLLALGAGFSLGREGPTVQIGAAFGKIIGDIFRIPRRSYAALIASGAGAGLAVAFNAPLAGFLFVMDELRKEMSPLTYGTAFVGSVCSVAVTRTILGQNPSFQIPHPRALPLGALGAIAVLGVVAGVAGVAFNKCLIGAIALRERANIPKWSAGLVVGVLSGLLLVKFPQISGGGHGLIGALLAGAYSPNNLLVLAFVIFGAKLLFTALSYGTGVPGGIFAPILVMGAFLGYGFGLAASRIYPGLGFDVVGFATIGMAGVLTASVRSPLTAVVLIVEMTAEYQLLYALLVGAFLSYATAELLGDDPIYEALLERDLHKAGRVASEDAEPAIVDLMVEPDSDMDGRRIRDLDLPEGALITGVSRDNGHIVPRGTTQLRAGDMITAVVDGDDLSVSVKIHEMAKAPA